MKLYFAQHGLAVSKEVDERRPLSAQGRKEVLRVANLLARAGVTMRQVCHSGKLRAKETAELFAQTLQVSEVAEQNGMAPEDDARSFVDMLESDIFYIGHLPHLQRVVSYLLAEDADLGVLRFKNAGVLCLEKAGDHYEVAWYVTPLFSVSPDAGS